MSRATVSAIADWTYRESRWRELVPYEVHQVNASDTHLQCAVEVRGGRLSRLEVTFDYLCRRADHNGYFVAARHHQELARVVARRTMSWAHGSHEADEIVDQAASLEAIVEIIYRYDPELTADFERHLTARMKFRTGSELKKHYRRKGILIRFLDRRLPPRPGRAERAEPIDNVGPERIVIAQLRLEAIRHQLGDARFFELLEYLEPETDEAKSNRDRKRLERIRTKVREVDAT